MFCPHCGKQTVDGVAFCSSCGGALAPVAVQPQQSAAEFQTQKNAIRQSEMKELNDAMVYFAPKAEQFQAYDRICDLLAHYSRGARSALLVWGCIIATCGLLFSGSLLISEPSAAFALMCILGLPGILMIVGGILMKVKNKKNLNYCQEEYARLSQELSDYYVSYPDCPVGPEYANPEILGILMDYLKSGRADTIKESINLAISDAKQNEMDEYMSAIAQQTAAINAQTKVATFFAAASFFR